MLGFVPHPSLPRYRADESGRQARRIAINIPIVSSAMDTVTEARLAIALAQEGGIGFIHKNMSIARQAEEVDTVKRSESGMILDPVTVLADQRVRDVIDVQFYAAEERLALRARALGRDQ